MDLRDHWEKDDCPAQKSITALKELLGLPVIIQLEPLILWSELQKFYPDQAIFVPSITAVIKTWTDCLARRLADDANATWTEQLLEYANEGGRNMKARVEVSLLFTASGSKHEVIVLKSPSDTARFSSQDRASEERSDIHHWYSRVIAPIQKCVSILHDRL